MNFTPNIPTFNTARVDSPYTVLTGGNNSGKSIVLKNLKKILGKTSYMVGTNRFYHVFRITQRNREPKDLDTYERQFLDNFMSPQANNENNPLDLNSILVNLNDSKRTSLFKVCGELIGGTFSLMREVADNELSHRYVDVDGKNLSLSSTGTRLLMTTLGICLDERFNTLMLDEPELGLSPRVQRTFAHLLSDATERSKWFPHLQRVFVATHSHIFLHSSDIGSNFTVSREGTEVAVRKVESVSDFHRVQFNMLGNRLEDLFLPAAIVYVEGPTDQSYLERVFSLKFPESRIIISHTDDSKRQIDSLRKSLGDLQRSPFKGRLFIVVDSKHEKGLKDSLVKMGVEGDNVVIWKGNGVEYVYPQHILAEIYKCPVTETQNLKIEGDNVTLNGITFRKVELCHEVLKQVSQQTQFPEELQSKLLAPMAKAIS